MDTAKPLEIFRTGTHTAVDGRTLEFTAAHLDDVVTSYDAASNQAPLVVGHPALDAPAYGWVKGLSVQGGLLYAEPEQVDPAFADLVNAGRFKKISASFYPPTWPSNPKPGHWYLRHIGFLGAAAPAVKGLRPASFAESESLTFEFAAPLESVGFGASLANLFRGIRAHLSGSKEPIEHLLPDDMLATLENSSGATVPLHLNTPAAATSPATQTTTTTEQEDPSMSQGQNPAEFAERERQLNEQQAQLDARDQALKRREIDARRVDVVSFAEGLEKEGKLLPYQRSAVVELLLTMDAQQAPLSFTEEGAQISKPAGTVLRELLTGLPKQVEFGRQIAAGKGNDSAPISFAAPANATVDNSRLELHQRALAYQAAHPSMSFIDAVRACGG